MISLTENAASEIRKVIKENELVDGTGIRLSIKGGGCAGFNYIIDFDNQPGEFDHLFDSHGIKIIVDQKSHLYIDGTEIDFNIGLTDRGFKFKNPKADTSCGCGTSFMPKQATFA